MNKLNAEINRTILALVSVGLLLLLFFPASLSANHFRYGTISWDLVDNDTITLKMQNGWTASHSCCSGSSVGGILNNYQSISWGDSSSTYVDFKFISKDTDADNMITNMGDSSSGWVTGVAHDFDNGSYVTYWGSSSRATVMNNGSNGTSWRNETMVRIGGDYIGNVSPVSAVPPIVNVQDNTSFTYQVSATDANGDNLNYRWGYIREFFTTDGSGDDTVFTMPTGMTLSSSGLIEWDIRDNITCTGCTNDDAVDDTTNKLWVAVIMVEDRLDNGTAKSYIPIDFFFQVTSADNAAPTIIGLPNTTQTVSSGSTKIITLTSTDDSGVAPTLTVLNPPSDDSSIWSTSSETSGGTTTYTMTFTPNSSMEGSSFVVNIRSTDAANMTKDQSVSYQVSAVANADPTVPVLLSPTDGASVTSPVTFKFEGSTDSDGDTLSYAMYVCERSDFSGCSGTNVTAGGNYVPPFNQNFHEHLLPWPNSLHAATISQPISQDFSMIPKWIIMLVMLGLLSGIISLSVKNITRRRIVFILFWLIVGMVSCKDSASDIVEPVGAGIVSVVDTVVDTVVDPVVDTVVDTVVDPVTDVVADGLDVVTDGVDTVTDVVAESGSGATVYTVTNSGYTSGTTYYWKVVASDPKGGSADSETRSFTVQ